MESLFIFGISLMLIYFIGQFAFGMYSQSAYNKLRSDIIAQGRLVSVIPVLAVATIAALPGRSQPQPRLPGAPPEYTATCNPQSKVQPPPYEP